MIQIPGFRLKYFPELNKTHTFASASDVAAFIIQYGLRDRQCVQVVSSDGTATPAVLWMYTYEIHVGMWRFSALTGEAVQVTRNNGHLRRGIRLHPKSFRPESFCPEILV